MLRLYNDNEIIMEKFKNKYRIPSARLPYWDYGSNAAYFVTICTQNREHFFGEITKGKMELSEIGKMAEKYWIEIPVHFPFVKLDTFIIMPNHVHGIIIIDKKDDDYNVETQDVASLKLMQKNKFGPQSKNLASIIRGFKIGVTKNARMTNPNFAWQSRFYDHIIRNEQSYYRISEYIVNNTLKWKDDRYYV